MSFNSIEKTTIHLEDARAELFSFLGKVDFVPDEIEALSANILTAEMAQKYSHGFARALWIADNVRSKKISFQKKEKMSVSQEKNLINIDAKKRVGPFAFQEALKYSLEELHNFAFLITAISNIGPYSGFITTYALQAIEQKAVFLSFVDSPSGLIPHGCKNELWGTSPITLGFPSDTVPLIIDVALAQETWGDHYLQSVIDETPWEHFSSPPIAEHKGSALALLVKILASIYIRPEVLQENARTSGVLFFLLSQDIFSHPRTIDANLCEVFRQVAEDSNSEARLPGQQTLQNIFTSQHKQAITTLKPVWEKFMTTSKNL